VKKLMNTFSKVLRRKPKPVVSTPLPDVGFQASGLETLVGMDIVLNAVDMLADVDTYRRQLSGDDPGLDHVLGGIEMTLARQLGREFNQYRG
jgi:hypothetical protein